MTRIEETRLGRLQPASRRLATLSLISVVAWGACGSRPPGPSGQKPTTLTVGFGSYTGGDGSAGLSAAVLNVALEGLVRFTKDGRAAGLLADSWAASPDGLSWRVRLRPSAVFSDGEPATAEIVRNVLVKDLPQNLGPAFDDVESIRAVSQSEVEFSLRRRSAFLVEGLEVPIASPRSAWVGTGPFFVSRREPDLIEMRANGKYYRGKPFIDDVVFKQYASLRAAWADMLRGQVDMLYEVGPDALDSLQPSTEVNVFTYQRHYAFYVVLNVARESLRDPAVRRRLNSAINRQTLIAQALRGHGMPADGAVWPYHWAYDAKLPRFDYRPEPVATGSDRIHLTCLFPESSVIERLALALQEQLQAVGVDLELTALPLDEVMARFRTGDFDTVLADVGSGPTLLRPYLYWHSGSPYNLGHFASRAVDEALDSIRHAADDAAYKAGVAAFQRATVDDPPAIFLAWSERARAVSRRFEVTTEPGVDWGSSLAQWKPVSGEGNTRRN